MLPEGFPLQASEGLLSPLGGFSFALPQTPGGLSMNAERAKRKLSAILSADVKGYSRLMGEDEVGTVRTLKEYREVMSKLIKEYRGRVVDSPGDNVLAEFASVVDALECSIEIQKLLRTKNAALSDSRKMDFRIGVNLGDVIEDEDRVYGDGVNIAARMEGLADGGGICISGTAFDQVKNKLSVGYQFLGKQTVKNIPDPVRAYKVLMEPEVAGKVIGEKEPRQRRLGWKSVAAIAVLFLSASGLVWNAYWRAPKIEPASKEKMAFPLPDKPSIVVLPFVNMSDDPQQEFFGDGLAEEIINALAKLSQIFVIARNSSFTYKGKTVDLKQVGRELGVKYVMEGSVRRDAQRVRVTAQLIEAGTGNHLFSERYDRALKDIFATQDEITIAVVRAVRVNVTSGEQARMTGRGTKNLDAYLKAIQANEQLNLFSRQGSVRAKEFAKEAISLDPKYAFPYAVLANAHMLDVWFRFSESPEESMKLADDAAHTALALEKVDPYVLSALANVYVMQRQYDRAIVSSEHALEISPGSARSQSTMATALLFACRFHEAIPFYEEAIRLDPYPPGLVFRLLGTAYSGIGRHDEALRVLQKALRVNPTDIFIHLGLAVVYVELGREEEARAAAKEVLRLHPKFSLDYFAKALTFKDQSFVDRRIERLRKAGLK
jgi:adenylate cyclase